MYAVLMQGLEVSVIGFLAVFAVLLVFYVVLLILDRIPEKEEAND